MTREQFKKAREEAQNAPELRKLNEEIEQLKAIDGVFKGTIKITSINRRETK